MGNLRFGVSCAVGVALLVVVVVMPVDRPRVCNPVPCAKAQPVMAFFGLEYYYARYQQAYRAWQRHGMLP